jgi:hypothetical protein
MNSLANRQKSEFARIFTVFGMSLVYLALFSSSLLAQAPDPHFQSNWSPNNYRIICDPPESCNFDKDAREAIENLLVTAVDDIQKLPFKAPTWWAPRKSDAVDEQDYIELYGSDSNFVAYVSCQSYGENKPIEQAIMNIGKRFRYFRDYNAEYWNYNFVNHEVFHLISYEYPFWDASKCGNVPGWVAESLATAFANHMMRKKYPSVWPSKRNETEARDFAGLRRYDQSLPVRLFNDKGEIRSGKDIYQRISSFWRHLAHTHHGGKYGFLANYMSNTAAGDDWVSWLRNNVQKHSNAELGMVFGGFLGDFAGWGDRGYPGEIFGRKKWLNEAFSGCQSIYLNKDEPGDYVEVDLLPLAGDCIEVSVATMGPSGVAKDESFAVQIAAMIMSGAPSSRGGLHLALAASNDKKDFLCAKEVKRSRKRGMGKCLFIPDDGKIRLGGGTVDARIWNVIAQEKGDPEEQRQRVDSESRAGELQNLYTISYTPTNISMRDMSYNSQDPITVRLYFVLDVARLDIEGNKKGAVGHFAQGADPQTTLPKQDSSGRRVNSFSKPDQFQPPVSVPANAPPQAQGKLSYFVVGQVVGKEGSPVSVVDLFPLRSRDVQGKPEPYPLSVGETGEFPLHVTGSLNGELIVGTGPGSLQVHEFTDLVFRAHFSATVCRVRDMAVEKGQQRDDPCRNPVPLSGDIVKAFAGSRLPGNLMVTERTEGTEIYRKANEQGMAEWFSPPEESPGTKKPGAPASTGVGSSSGGTLSDCACTCEEFAQTKQLAEDFKAREAAGEEVSAGAIMGLMRCSQPCQSEYMMCTLAEDRKKKAREKAEKAAREAKLAGECDCSCSALAALQTRSEELLKSFEAGASPDMAEMQRLGRCVAVCQNEMMSCAQSK